MSVKNKVVAQNPQILRCHRLMEAFAKSDDERDFYLDRQEGFLVYVDLDKTQDELDELEKELTKNANRYCMVPKLTFYEIKKVMEGFVNEKVYDIDTKEKLLDIIQSKEARENFLEFIYDHHTELEKWQQYYQERFRVRIIEWLRNNQFDFVFEEDLELTKAMCEKLKMNLFIPKVSKDLLVQRKNLGSKAKTYYSSEALNPRPKRGRPPKQVAKVETEPQFSQDIYTTVPKAIKPFLFTPDYHGSSAIFTFSGKFASEADLLAHRRQQLAGSVNLDMQNLNQKLAALRTLSSTWNLNKEEKEPTSPHVRPEEPVEIEIDFEGIQTPLNSTKAKKEALKPGSKPVSKSVIKKDEERLATPVLLVPKTAKPLPVKTPVAKAPAKLPNTKVVPKAIFRPVPNIASKSASKSAFKPASKTAFKTAFKPVPNRAAKGALPKKSVAKAPNKQPFKKAPPKARLRPLPQKANKKANPAAQSRFKPAPTKPAPSKQAPSKAVPSKLGPSKPVSSKSAPAKLVPSKLVPSKLVPSKLVSSKPAPAKKKPSTLRLLRRSKKR